MIGYALCGSFCTIAKSLKAMEELLRAGYEIQPLMSEIVYATDTRFGKAEDLRQTIRALCGREIIHTVVGAEPIGPKGYLDLLLIAPCTGNTLAKMAHGITDGCVTMAAKAMLRGDKPVVVALASNDALGANLSNIATMRNRKNITFVPLSMDDPEKKPYSLVADFEQILPTVDKILKK